MMRFHKAACHRFSLSPLCHLSPPSPSSPSLLLPPKLSRLSTLRTHRCARVRRFPGNSLTTVMSSRSASRLRCLASVCPGGGEDGGGDSSSNGSVSASASTTEDDGNCSISVGLALFQLKRESLLTTSRSCRIWNDTWIWIFIVYLVLLLVTGSNSYLLKIDFDCLFLISFDDSLCDFV